MNAIKLPVVAFKVASDLWSIKGADFEPLFSSLTESEANQIALALNSHDALVEALKSMTERYCGMANSGDCGFWDCEPEPVVISARAALAKVEDLRNKQHQTT